MTNTTWTSCENFSMFDLYDLHFGCKYGPDCYCVLVLRSNLYVLSNLSTRKAAINSWVILGTSKLHQAKKNFKRDVSRGHG